MLKFEEQIADIKQQAREGKLPSPVEVEKNFFPEEIEEMEQSMKLIRKMDREKARVDKKNAAMMASPIYKAFRDEIELISMDLTKKLCDKGTNPTNVHQYYSEVTEAEEKLVQKYTNRTGDANERIRRTAILMEQKRFKEGENFRKLMSERSNQLLFGYNNATKRVKIIKK